LHWRKKRVTCKGMKTRLHYKTVIIGAGAAGMMCAAHAGGSCLVIDHAKAPGEKIRISGGGRCNFTNIYASPENFISGNPHFAKSALARYTQWDFIDLVARHGIAYHEKTLGQLFCDISAKDIIAMLLAEMKQADAALELNTSVTRVSKSPAGFDLDLNDGRKISAANVVIATGGKSIPKMGASGFAYDIARQFGLPLTEIRPALVPLTFPDGRFAPLAGVATPARIHNTRASFDEAMLFTHRGLSGPAILQISSYWREGEEICVDLLPETDLFERLRTQRQTGGRRNLTTELAQILPARLVEYLAQVMPMGGNLADQSDAALKALQYELKNWRITANGSEGYRTAEVTLGGIDTDALDARTLQAKSVPNLYFIGEAVDVTGWLGGYNFQWAWSSGWAAGTAIAAG
jgi:predicted Rossmann fold flavoprotein